MLTVLLFVTYMTYKYFAKRKEVVSSIMMTIMNSQFGVISAFKRNDTMRRYKFCVTLITSFHV